MIGASLLWSIAVLTTDDVLSSSGKYPARLQWVSPAVEKNAAELAERVNLLLSKFGASRTLNSGFRDPESNKQVNGAPYSRHMYGQAADIEDADRRLAKWVTAEILEECGLWAEDPKHTLTWVHVQSVPPRNSTRRFFIP